MNIAVYCGAYTGNDDAFRETAWETGTWIGTHGHTLIYGAGKTGMMKIVADAVKASGGKVIGVIPNVATIRENVHSGIDQVIETATLPERKTKMIELSDAFIALPGGTGTFDEITEILSLNCLGVIEAPAVFMSVKGYYEPVKAMLDNALSNGFSKETIFDRLIFTDRVDEAGMFIEQFVGKA